MPLVLDLLRGGQLLACCVSASPSSVYPSVKLINWYGTWPACAAGPKGTVSGVFIRRNLGSRQVSKPFRSPTGIRWREQGRASS